MDRHTGRTSAFTLGLIAGIINLIIGIAFSIVLIVSHAAVMEQNGMYMPGEPNLLLIGIFFFIFMLLNLIGGALCKSNRITGGIMIALTALPVLIACIIALSGLRDLMNQFINAGLVQNSAAYDVYNALEITLIIFVIIQAVSVLGAILAFIPYSREYRQMRDTRQGGYAAPYANPYQPQYQQPQYQQPQYQQPQYRQPQYRQPYQQPQYQRNKFDPYTDKPFVPQAPQNKFDPYTGKPIVPQTPAVPEQPIAVEPAQPEQTEPEAQAPDKE